MKVDHVHFYVDDAAGWRDWFVKYLGFQSISAVTTPDTYTEIVRSGKIRFFLSSPLTQLSPVAKFLCLHPPGVADIAFCVPDVAAVMERAIASGAKVIQPLQNGTQGEQCFKWGKIAAWGDLSHTLIQRSETTAPSSSNASELCFTDIDHMVLNVASGDLERAVDWYKNIFDFHYQQKFDIQTARSGLHSQVMSSNSGHVKLPINEPASPNSQIQEFLDVNRGPGIQHIALQTSNILQTLDQLLQRGLALLSVPREYYIQLQQHPELPISIAQLQEIAQAQILIDWQDTTPQALLLQTFTKPIFEQPTFFFELIERRRQAQGFGEGNFRALFEAIEREQCKRGTLR